MTKSTLQQQLETLSAARYPLHMPGHKRRVPPAPGLGCYAWDLTEIDGASSTLLSRCFKAGPRLPSAPIASL